MKWIIILVLILVLVAMIAYKYRKHIQTGWIMWKAFRNFRQQMKPRQQQQVPERDTKKDTPLVSCPKCGKWTPQDEAVKLKSNFYCSLVCMEESLSVKS